MLSINNSPQLSMPILHDALALMDEQDQQTHGPEYETLRQKFLNRENQKALSNTLVGNYHTYPECNQVENLDFGPDPRLMTHDIMKRQLINENGIPHILFKISNDIAFKLLPGENHIDVHLHRSLITGALFDLFSGSPLLKSGKQDLIDASGRVNSIVLLCFYSIQNYPVRTMYENFLKDKIFKDLTFIPFRLCRLIAEYSFVCQIHFY